MSAILAALGVRGLGWLAFTPITGAISMVATVFNALVSFFSTKFGQWVGIGLIAVAVFYVGDFRGRRIEKAKWDAAIEAADQQRAQRDEEIRQATSAETAVQLAAIQKRADELQKEVESYANAQPANVCRADDGAAKRLRKY